MSFIQLNQVSKIYESDKGVLHALDDINLSIQQGEIFGIIGYSGAGKSTLLRLLNGLEYPSSGTVNVNHKCITDLKGYELRAFRERVGMIFQHFNLLWSRTVFENIALPLELSGKKNNDRIQELIRLVGLEGKEDAYPSQLSGGQKQRVGIARALANDPMILLCDEATSALDPQTTDEVLELLANINQQLNLTIVLITHEMPVIRKICNRVAVMERGKIIEEGSVIDIFRHPKTEVTKRFITQEFFQEEGNRIALLEELKEAHPEGYLVNLTFKGDQSKTPVLSEVIKHTPITVNVLQGQIQQAQGIPIGLLTIQMTGQDQDLQKAIDYFKQHHVEVEVLE